MQQSWRLFKIIRSFSFSEVTNNAVLLTRFAVVEESVSVERCDIIREGHQVTRIWPHPQQQMFHCTHIQHHWCRPNFGTNIIHWANNNTRSSATAKSTVRPSLVYFMKFLGRKSVDG